MFASLTHALLGVLLVMQLSPSIAAPTRSVDAFQTFESRANDNNRVSLFKNALPEDGAASPFIILDAPASTITAHVEQSRSLQFADGPGLLLHSEPLDDEPEDEGFGWIGTDIDPLEATALKVKRCLGDGTDIERLGGGLVFKAKRHLPEEGSDDCGGIGTDVEPMGVAFKVKRHLPGGGNSGSSRNPGSDSNNSGGHDSGGEGKARGIIFHGGGKSSDRQGF